MSNGGRVWDENILREIIEEGNGKKLNEVAEKLGRLYAERNLSTSQIRSVLNEIQSMQRYDEHRLQLLRPKLAYVAGRHFRNAPIIKEDFQPLMDQSIRMVNKDNFKNFKNFVEAIVAYHRFYGGKE